MYPSGTSSTDSPRRSDEDLDLSALNLTGATRRPRFHFPLARSRSCLSDNGSSCNSCQSDGSASDIGGCRLGSSRNGRSRRRKRRTGGGGTHPALGVYWDIENCHVPKNKSAASLVRRIRDTFMDKYREAEFVVVCDVKKENPQVIQDLHDAQVSLIHVSSISKNAADEKLRQSLRRFAEVYAPPAAVLLISSDVNFAADLCDLRYRRKIRVILIHNSNVADALILCANETYNFSDITENLPLKTDVADVVSAGGAELLIYNLPSNQDRNRIKNRLKLLTDNCGGRVINIALERGIATVRFSSPDVASRAQRRIQGEDVYGNKIKVVNPSGPKEREVKQRGYGGRKVKTADVQQHFVPLSVVQPTLVNQTSAWKSVPELSNQLLTPSWPIRRNSFGERRPCTPQEDATFAAAPSKAPNGQQPVVDPPILYISNLEPMTDLRPMRKLLMAKLSKYAKVVSLNMLVHPDGHPYAIAKVGSQQEAQYLISQLQKQKLGNKRMVISYIENNSPDPDQLKAMIISLLQEAPGQRMPLFKLLELLETRYHSNVPTSEVIKMKDVCRITEDSGGRVVFLAPEFRSSPTPNVGMSLTLYCSVHCPNGIQNKGWGEPNIIQIPNVMISSKSLTVKVNDLLTSHMGVVPLLTFRMCYEAEFGEPLPIDDNGVPLEHLLTCLPNVQLKYSDPNKNIKYIKRETTTDTDEESVLRGVPPSLLPNVNLLCRELVDLLRTTERCQLSWNRFIPAYHHHFGRQCRLAAYGHTKLQDLFDSIPHVIQVIGDASRRTITLSHQAQMKRFHADLVRVLKGQHSKQVTVEELPTAYERIFNRVFSPVEYGLCFLDDLLAELPTNTVVVTRSNDVVTIGIPKREQTPEEVVRTRHFATEVFHLLRHSPDCSMLFNKFVPSYHHHFGYQCRVADFGFAKLIELFEAISDVVKIEELPDGDRRVCLTPPYALKVLGMQVVDLIRASHLDHLPLEALPAVYLREFGHPLKPEAYGCGSMLEVAEMLHDVVQVNYTRAGALLVMVNSDAESDLAIRVWTVMRNPPYSMSISSFMRDYQARYNVCVKVQNLEKLKSVIEISGRTTETCLTLTSWYILASELYNILCDCGGQMAFADLQAVYKRTWNKSLDVKSVVDLVQVLKDYFCIHKGKWNLELGLGEKLAEQQPQAEQLQWPPPPAHELLLSHSRKKVVPPKPDTPPNSVSAPWEEWSTPTRSRTEVNLTIALPKMPTPKLPSDWMNQLISPANDLLYTYAHPLDSAIPMISAPDPVQLPHPNKLLGKGDDSHDSGVINNDSSESEACRY